MPHTRGVHSVGRTKPPGGPAVMNASALLVETANLTLASNERLAAELEKSTLVGPGGDHAAARVLGDLNEKDDHYTVNDRLPTAPCRRRPQNAFDWRRTSQLKTQFA